MSATAAPVRGSSRADQPRLTAWRTLAAAGAIALWGCGGEDSAARQKATSRPSAAQPPFVVFRQPELVIDQIEVPVPAPVTVGSRPSPATMSSDAPDVVSVGQDGRLVAHRSGRATIRALGAGSSTLAVQVLAASAGVVEPPALTIPPGAEGSLKFLVAGGGEEAPPAAVKWFTSDPEVALIERGRVRAGRKPGVTRVTAIYGGARAGATVTVAAAPAPEFAVRPDRARLRRGEIVAFEAISRVGPVQARWSVRDPGVVAQVGDNAFQGRSPGRTAVCAEAPPRSRCVPVEVGR